MSLEKYKWKNRILLVETQNYTNEKYKDAKEKYNKNLKEFHNRYIKMISRRNKQFDFKIKLIGFDGEVKKVYKKMNVKNIFSTIEKMPMGKLRRKNKKINPTNLSLYSDYNKKTTTPGLGFKNKEKAKYTLKKIKNRDINYQVNVVSTMIGRAKNHPYKTKEMEGAIKVFEKWMREYKKNKN
jgi:hypothetical protein